jgi:hypothetical protein
MLLQFPTFSSFSKHILGALFSPGLVLIAAALLANKKPNLFFLPQYKCFY